MHLDELPSPMPHAAEALVEAITKAVASGHHALARQLAMISIVQQPCRKIRRV